MKYLFPLTLLLATCDVRPTVTYAGKHGNYSVSYDGKRIVPLVELRGYSK
jgi:hypothetical protein